MTLCQIHQRGKQMDKKSIIGIILIVLITLLMPVYQKWISGDKPPQIPPVATETELKKDSVEKKVAEPQPIIEKEETKPQEVKTEPEENLVAQSAATEKTITIESELFSTKWSTQNGGNPTTWILKEYEHFGGGYVNLIDSNYLDIRFLNKDGRNFHLNNYNLESSFSDGTVITLDENHPSVYLQFYLPVENGKIEKNITLYYDKYSFDVDVKLVDLNQYIINRQFFLTWYNGLSTTEENVSDDNSYCRAYVHMADESENIDADDKREEKSFSGRVDWVATRTKYFLSAIAPFDNSDISGAIISSQKFKEDDIETKDYDITLETEYNPSSLFQQKYLVYLGPLDHYKLKKYDLGFDEMVLNKDWYERLFRPISLLILPAFKFLYRFIPNYGLVIILFSILVKLILYPLTKKSYKSMSEMQYLQPKLAELKEKYQNDQQRYTRETMKLYKESGVNPMGGCLPMLLQMPLLFSLFIVFRSTIQLRGKPFFLWITDLSRPDILHMGFNLPLLGDSIHILPILMGITSIWQSKVSMTDPKQKAMIYFMPIFMIFIFYSLPSGLNLYYTMFNLLTMYQTAQIKKKMHPKEA